MTTTDNSHKPLQSLNDIEYFRVTSIAEFAQCPRRWLAKQLGEGKQTESPYSTMGTSVHLAIEKYLKGEYDQIIIDSPPVLGLADAPRLASIVDGTLMVMEANRSHRG